MYGRVDNLNDVGALESWLRFEDRGSFEPIQEGWIPVHRNGRWNTSTDVGVVRQGFHIRGFLVMEEQVDDLLQLNPKGMAPEFDFKPMRYGGRAGSGKYWEEDSVRVVEGREALRFVMSFTREPPLVDPGFIEYHQLVEEQKRNFQTYDSNEFAVRFPFEKWKDITSPHKSPYDTPDTVRDLTVRSEFLKDYIQERDCVLVLSYFQNRAIKDIPKERLDLGLHEEEFELLGGTAVRDVHPERPNVDFNWFCPIRASDISIGWEERQANVADSLRFQTRSGLYFTKQEVIAEEGFEEAGYRRPAVGAEDLKEALSFFGWLFFDPAVLEKYKNDRRGEVEEWSASGLIIRWLDKMILTAYKNDEAEIVVILDDLREIPNSELAHWRQHQKMTPNGDIPEEMIRNYLDARPVESDSLAGSLIMALTELDRAFETTHGESLIKSTGDDIDRTRIGMLSRNEREELLSVMSATHKILIENLDRSSLEMRLPKTTVENDIEGPKSAFFEYIAHVSDKKTAATIMEPINAVYDFRQEDSHRKVENGGWDRALTSLGLDSEEDNFRFIYQETMERLVESIHEIRRMIMIG